MSFETFDQSDEKTWYGQKDDNDKDKDNDKYKDNDKGKPSDLYHLWHWLQFW